MTPHAASTLPILSLSTNNPSTTLGRVDINTHTLNFHTFFIIFVVIMKNNGERLRIRLPYERRPMDFGSWVWVHRHGVMGTLVVLLIFGIAFVAWRIDWGDSLTQRVIYMEMEPPPDQQEKPPVKEVAPVDYGRVSNRSSNENAALDARLRRAMTAGDEELQEAAQELGDELAANRAAYEAGLKRNQKMIDDARQSRQESAENSERSARHGGNVTASYSFVDPVRHDLRLDIPAYRCLGGGRVVVAASLDVNGRVTSAEVDKGSSTSDDCLQREALASARASRFNMDTSAPARHRGTITYIFVPQ